MRFRTDNPAPAVLAVLKDFPIGRDEAFRGEIQRLKENRSFRMNWRKGGVTLDGFGEILLDRGIVAERPTPDELLCYFDDLFRSNGRKRGRNRATAGSIEDMHRHAKDVRFRLYECRCGQKIRGTRQTSVACGRCLPGAFETIAREVAAMVGNPAIADAIMATVQECIPVMERKDPLPEEILAQSFETMEGTEKVYETLN
jgi:hypothetical protein